MNKFMRMAINEAKKVLKQVMEAPLEQLLSKMALLSEKDTTKY